MKWCTLVLAASVVLVTASPIAPSFSISPNGPCSDVRLIEYQSRTKLTLYSQSKVDAILKGEMDASECCSYGKCKGDVVVSVGG
jgi:hypothetical protein